MTGNRFAPALGHSCGDTFCLTYDDGISDLAIMASIVFHLGHGRLASITAVHKPGKEETGRDNLA